MTPAGPYTWAAVYRDGRIVLHVSPDGKTTSADDLPREGLETFVLVDPKGNQVFRLHLDPGQKLVYRRRIWSTDKGDISTCHLLGWRKNVMGENVQAMAYVFESGTIEMAGDFRENHPVFDSPVIRSFEK